MKQKHLIFAVITSMAAILITTTMDATGLAAFSAFPLMGLMLLSWIGLRYSSKEIGFRIGKPKHYLIAIAYPLSVMSLIFFTALMVGDTDLVNADLNRVLRHVLIGGSVGILMCMLTEEGFFRGYLWAGLRRSGQSEKSVLIMTTIVFTLWHVSVVVFPTGFDLPVARIPVYLANVFLIGATWGLMRLHSGSIIVPSVSHAVWNGMAYSLFGVGTRNGELGIQNSHVFAPEVGWLGVVLNLGFLIGLYHYYSKSESKMGREKVVSASRENSINPDASPTSYTS